MANIYKSSLSILMLKPTVALLFLLLSSHCQRLIISSPPELAEEFANNRIKVHLSPLGLKPKAGILHGQLKLSTPASACKQVQTIDASVEEDTFLMADDTGCLESVKARNIAHSGAYIGIIKRNINNTLHDREVDIVHIPIVEVEPIEYEKLREYLESNTEATIAVQVDFSQDPEVHRKIKMELWFSPTESKAITYITEMKSFILNQPDNILFQPRFVMHSQTATKQYVGCFSSGRFCPPEIEFEGKPEGTKILSESLRELIIARGNLKKWFRYVYQFERRCLRVKEAELWTEQNSELCSENIMRSQGIDTEYVFSEYNKSFQGSRPAVDGNIYLEEERQDYLLEKVNNYPVLLVNGKGYPLDNVAAMKLKICNMINPNPDLQTKECRKITKPDMFSGGEILMFIGIFLVLMVGVMFIYKFFIHNRMKVEMRGEVDKTLSQYYRYMETLEEPDAATGKVPLVEEKIDSNQIGSVELTDVKDKQ